jgi:hypothetical protein
MTECPLPVVSHEPFSFELDAVSFSVDVEAGLTVHEAPFSSWSVEMEPVVVHDMALSEPALEIDAEAGVRFQDGTDEDGMGLDDAEDPMVLGFGEVEDPESLDLGELSTEFHHDVLQSKAFSEKQEGMASLDGDDGRDQALGDDKLDKEVDRVDKALGDNGVDTEFHDTPIVDSVDSPAGPLEHSRLPDLDPGTESLVPDLPAPPMGTRWVVREDIAIDVNVTVELEDEAGVLGPSCLAPSEAPVDLPLPTELGPAEPLMGPLTDQVALLPSVPPVVEVPSVLAPCVPAPVVEMPSVPVPCAPPPIVEVPTVLVPSAPIVEVPTVLVPSAPIMEMGPLVSAPIEFPTVCLPPTLPGCSTMDELESRLRCGPGGYHPRPRCPPFPGELCGADPFGGMEIGQLVNNLPPEYDHVVYRAFDHATGLNQV